MRNAAPREISSAEQQSPNGTLRSMAFVGCHHGEYVTGNAADDSYRLLFLWSLCCCRDGNKQIDKNKLIDNPKQANDERSTGYPNTEKYGYCPQL